MAQTAHVIFQQLAKASPMLKVRLKQAGIDIKPEDFIKKTMLSAFYLSAGLSVFLFLVLARLGILKKAMLAFPPFLFIAMFFYMGKFPEYRIIRKEKDISREIVFAGRFLIVEIESGVPLYNALISLSKNFKVIGKYTEEIVEKVELGTSLEDALAEASEIVPSSNFRRIIWQILNSLRTGSNVGSSLKNVIEQIAKEQTIEVSKYGKKLNPLAMFYMVLSVIMPTLGITMLIILSSFIQFNLSLGILLFLAGLFGFVQFMFVSIIKFSRPPIDL